MTTKIFKSTIGEAAAAAAVAPIIDEEIFVIPSSGRIANATFAANYDVDINATYADGIKTGTPFGGASVSNGKLDLTGGTIKFVDYDANLNADSQQVGTIKFKVTPNYSGSPTDLQFFISVAKSSTVATNLIAITHQPSGNINITVRNSANLDLIVVNLGIFNPTAGVESEFELNYDLTTGATRLFIDGVQLGITITNTGIRSSDINVLRIGCILGFVIVDPPDFEIDDVLIFNTVQHTSNYTPGYQIFNATPAVLELTQDEIDNLVDPKNGSDVFNITTGKKQVRESGAYVNVVNGAGGASEFFNAIHVAGDNIPSGGGPGPLTNFTNDLFSNSDFVASELVGAPLSTNVMVYTVPSTGIYEFFALIVGAPTVAGLLTIAIAKTDFSLFLTQENNTLIAASSGIQSAPGYTGPHSLTIGDKIMMIGIWTGASQFDLTAGASFFSGRKIG